ncbi:MAG: hypothetical protein GY862_23865 [Gammaproteobacteria bacterium]|nr:hypothetical protein [Gammaproteobacteria bacterium]
MNNTPCSWTGVTCSSGGGVSELVRYNQNLSGSIPVELGNLANLTFIYLPTNQLSGSIPVELGNLTNLTYLDLYDNQLSGSIPVELGNLTNLTFLGLDSNQLSGSIPVELGNLTNLRYLYLSDNQLSGSIPVELGNLTNLTYLYLYNNQLSGSIPVELGNLTNLTSLHLYSNQLSGSIPVELGNLTNLTRLYLRNNQLSGSIPVELGNLTNLTVLTLGNNQKGLAPDEHGTDPLSHPRIVLLGFCYSGSFIPALSKAPADDDAGRIIISSAAANEESYKGPREKPEPGEPDGGVPGGEFFMDALFNYLGRSKPAYSLYDAFAEATLLTEQYTRISSDGMANSASPFADNAIQHPLLDNNGDGRGSNLLSIVPGQDGYRVDGIYLGAHVESPTNSIFSITRVTSTHYLEPGQTSAELFAEVSDIYNIDSIRADVRKPGVSLQRPPTPSSIQLEVELDGDYLGCDDPLNLKRCSWNSPVFADDEPGMYEVFYSVRDKRGGFAPVKHSVVYKKLPAGQNQPPTAPELILPSNNQNVACGNVECACPPAGICPLTALLFDWTDSTDTLHKVTYTLSIALDADFTNIIYQAEELTESMHGASTAAKIDDGRNDGSLGLKDQTLYYWKAEAVDSYGEKSSSTVFVFMTSNNPNPAPSIFSGRIITEVTRQPLKNTTITPPADVNSQIVTSGGSYLMTLPSGRHDITARAPNHQAQTVTVDVARPEIELNFVLQPRASYQDGVLFLPEAVAGDLAASVWFSLEDPSQLIFKLDSYEMKLLADHPKPARYSPGQLFLPELQAGTELYEVHLIQISPSELRFQVDLEVEPPKYIGVAE